MLGPARDTTGFEQGGINSGDLYKLYNNIQLKAAQSSSLGVDIGSSVVSAIGQADDVMLAANSVDSLRLLAKLTETYCADYRVKLVPIDGASVKFVDEAEHVGVIRSTAGNMPHILQRITSHKKDLGAKGQRGNPTSSLRIH